MPIEFQNNLNANWYPDYIAVSDINGLLPALPVSGVFYIADKTDLTTPLSPSVVASFNDSVDQTDPPPADPAPVITHINGQATDGVEPTVSEFSPLIFSGIDFPDGGLTTSTHTLVMSVYPDMTEYELMDNTNIGNWDGTNGQIVIPDITKGGTITFPQGRAEFYLKDAEGNMIPESLGSVQGLTVTP